MTDTSRPLAEIPTITPLSLLEHPFIPHVILDGAVVPNQWQRLPIGETFSASIAKKVSELGDMPYTALALEHCLAAFLQGTERNDIGVWLGPADDPAFLQNHLTRLAQVQIWFPSFTDGRGYSSARLLRDRYGYQGELRAVGDVGYDQLHPLQRCGFNAFELKPQQDPYEGLRYLKGFSHAYQNSVSDPSASDPSV